MNTFTDWPHGGDESCGWEASLAAGPREGSRLSQWLHLALGGGLVLGVAALLLVGATWLLPGTPPRGAAVAVRSAESAPPPVTESPLVRAAVPEDRPASTPSTTASLPRLEAPTVEEPAAVESVPMAAAVPVVEKGRKKRA